MIILWWHENNNTGAKIREQGRPVSGSIASGTEVGVPSVATCAEKIKQKSHDMTPDDSDAMTAASGAIRKDSDAMTAASGAIGKGPTL